MLPEGPREPPPGGSKIIMAQIPAFVWVRLLQCEGGDRFDSEIDVIRSRILKLRSEGPLGLCLCFIFLYVALSARPWTARGPARDWREIRPEGPNKKEYIVKLSQK